MDPLEMLKKEPYPADDGFILLPSPRPAADSAALPEGLPVALLLNSFQIGGSERQALMFAGYLRAHGARPVILGLSGPGPLTDVCREHGIPSDVASLHCPFCFWRLPWNLGRAVRLFRRHRPRIVMSYTSVSHVYAAMLRNICGMRTVIWNQRNAGLDRPPPSLETFSAGRMDSFIANSPSSREYLTFMLGIPTDRVALIPNGVQIPSAVSRSDFWRKRFHIPPESLLGCMIANLRPPKDPLTLVHAWQRATADGTPAAGMPHLILAGRNDALFDATAAAIRELKIGHRVHLAGYCDKIPGLLAETDVAVFSSRSEGLPNGVLEPMAAGKAVVATDLPGTRYCLGERMQEWLVPPGDVAAMADRVRRLLADRGLRREIGQRNRDRAQTLFSVDATCRATLDWILTH